MYFGSNHHYQITAQLHCVYSWLIWSGWEEILCWYNLMGRLDFSSRPARNFEPPIAVPAGARGGNQGEVLAPSASKYFTFTQNIFVLNWSKEYFLTVFGSLVCFCDKWAPQRHSGMPALLHGYRKLKFDRHPRTLFTHRKWQNFVICCGLRKLILIAIPRIYS